MNSIKKHLDDKYKCGEVGSGRAIPVKQGYLYKKSVKTLNKEWKKKYVTLTTDGRLTYHPTLHDYMEDIHGKNIPLKHTTVKIPGRRPLGSQSTPHSTPASAFNNSDILSDLNLSIGEQTLTPSTNAKMGTPRVKKKHRKVKNSDNLEDSEAYEFMIVSLDNKQWHFEANNCEERECWVSAIELQILTSLQNMESEKSKYRHSNSVDASVIQSIRTIPGNTNCVDCDSPNPDWSSLNLGVLICIECSGIHRNLGTHISKVRSLALDDWPPGHISVMMALGNTCVNNFYEHNLKGRAKPTPNSSREEKERWIRAKYEHKEFLVEVSESPRIEQQLIDAIIKSDIKQLFLILAHISSNDQINLAFYTRDVKTPLHLASSRGSLAIVQLLLWRNANVKAIDSNGKTALFYAKMYGHKEVEELLLQNGGFQMNNNKKHLDEKYKSGEVGSGRAIPVKQGYLYKKSVKTLNKEWKKKYVTLTTDGRLTYHPTLHDYIEDIHGKSIPLKHTTVKIPGRRPLGSQSTPHSTPASAFNNSDILSDLNNLSIGGVNNGTEQRLIPSTNAKMDTPSVKKKHRRLKINGNKNYDNLEDSEAYEFIILSLDNKQWHFEANNCEERECWVSAIELQILTSLQNMESEKSKYRHSNSVDASVIQSIRTIPGNTNCVDCDSPNPDWSSLNLGVLICIECSGIHRNLGTHISKVRSLALDDWPPGHISVMMALGNTCVNNFYEHNLKGRAKPTPNSSREEKERWIRAKYEHKEFLVEVSESPRIEQQLIDAIIKSDIKQLFLILAHISSNDQINLAFYTRDVKTPLHLASSRGSLAIVQLLLWHNANVKAIDSNGKTALFYAKTSGYKDVEELLVQNGCSEMNSNGTNNGIMTGRRGSLTSLATKYTDVFDKLPASVV